MPQVLSEFIVWAGEMLAGEGGDGGTARRDTGSGNNQRRFTRRDEAARDEAASIEEEARRYVGGGGSRLGGSDRSAAVSRAAEGMGGDEEDLCCICLERLADPVVRDELGEPLETACGHRFHAVCYACHMERSEQDPRCPTCRSVNLSARFPAN